MFQRTSAINKILAMTARKKVIQGSTAAGKTHGVIPILIDRCCKTERLKVTAVAETLPAVKEGALDIFMTIMQETGRWSDGGWNASSLTYTFANKARMQFKSFDTVGKAKASGKRDILFINEGNYIPFEIADALMIRSKETYIDFNPDNKFWVHEEVLTEPNSEFLLLTFEDNEAIPVETLEDLLIKKAKAFINPALSVEDLFKDTNIKSAYWANWWKVYGLGQIGMLEGVIFQNWSIIKKVPADAKLLGYGLDFGFDPDPAAMIAVYQWNKKLILDEVIYQKGLINSNLSKLITAAGAKVGPIYADSSDPKSISDLQGYGIGIYKVNKPTIKEGIKLMQEYDYLVTERSIYLQEELTKYKWSKKKPGEPITIFNHCIDAVRYLVWMVLGSRGSSTGVASFTMDR